jgi:hypothetical protein
MRQTYVPLVWQCRYSGIEVRDRLWRYVQFGEGKKYADNQAGDMVREKDVMRRFDEWTPLSPPSWPRRARSSRNPIALSDTSPPATAAPI